MDEQLKIYIEKLHESLRHIKEDVSDSTIISACEVCETCLNEISHLIKISE
jgi:hypothetical protein